MKLQKAGFRRPRDVTPKPKAILSHMVFGESITYSLVLGAALVIVGVYLTESLRSNRFA
jgi:hypothetical protein